MVNCGQAALNALHWWFPRTNTPNGNPDFAKFIRINSTAQSLPQIPTPCPGMNAEVDESAEERKGGAGGLGKMLLSAGDKQLAIVCHVPKALQESNESFNIKEWVQAVVGATGATVTEEGEEVSGAPRSPGACGG